MERIGTKIKECRQALGWSQSRLAEEIGVSKNTILNWEQDKTLPDVLSLNKLLSCFDMTFEEFFEEERNKETSPTERGEPILPPKNILRSTAHAFFVTVYALFFFVALLSFFWEKTYYLYYITAPATALLALPVGVYLYYRVRLATMPKILERYLPKALMILGGIALLLLIASCFLINNLTFGLPVWSVCLLLGGAILLPPLAVFLFRIAENRR
ncbi:MAG: helix-turn-helix transcriptional regulator [Clostridia bacterium]|nr:helix-turn-helix transcriptional regulator [Clostridia bacterium]